MQARGLRAWARCVARGPKHGPSAVQSYFPDYVDRSLRLTSYWADCELRMGEGIAGARAVWEDALKTPAGRCCALCPTGPWRPQLSTVSILDILGLQIRG